MASGLVQHDMSVHPGFAAVIVKACLTISSVKNNHKKIYIFLPPG